MSEVFKELGDKFLKVFVDDLNVHSESWEEHFQHLSTMFLKLREVNLKLNPSKCCFIAKSITFLGHVVNNEGTKPDPGKFDAVLHFPKTKDNYQHQVFSRPNWVLLELCARLFTTSYSIV